METDEMGRVLTEATIENMEDLWASKRGMLADDAVRRITVDDALVDTGATLLSMPTRMIEQLGLEQTRRAETVDEMHRKAGIDTIRLFAGEPYDRQFINFFRKRAQRR